jgi:hypothetical protein
MNVHDKEGRHKPVTATLAVRIAKFAKVGVDEVLTGWFPSQGTCPHYGHRAEGDASTAAPRNGTLSNMGSSAENANGGAHG